MNTSATKSATNGKSGTAKTPPLPHVFDEDFLGYLAGFIDSDGSFRRPGGSPQGILTNTNKETLLQLRKQTGSSMGEYHYESSHYGEKPRYWLTVKSKIATLVAPYCVKANLTQTANGNYIAGPTKINWGYVAGFLDGDGAITFVKNSKLYIVRFMGASPKNLIMLKRIHAFINIGTFRTEAKPLAHHRYPNSVIFVAQHDEVVQILKSVVPWLIIKRAKAEEALKFIESKNWQAKRPIEGKVTFDQLKRMYYDEKKGFPQIARELGVSESGVRWFAAKNGGMKARDSHDPAYHGLRVQGGIRMQARLHAKISSSDNSQT